MASPEPAPAIKPKTRVRSERAPGRVAPTAAAPLPVHASVLEEARRTGLLGGEKSEHVSFRAPPALVEAAKRGTGVTSTSELGMLAMLAQPDPVVAFMRQTRGRLGKDHTLEY